MMRCARVTAMRICNRRMQQPCALQTQMDPQATARADCDSAGEYSHGIGVHVVGGTQYRQGLY